MASWLVQLPRQSRSFAVSAIGIVFWCCSSYPMSPFWVSLLFGVGARPSPKVGGRSGYANGSIQQDVARRLLIDPEDFSFGGPLYPAREALDFHLHSRKRSARVVPAYSTPLNYRHVGVVACRPPKTKVKVTVKVGAWLNRFRFALGPDDPSVL